MGDLEEALSSWLQTGTALAFVIAWGVISGWKIFLSLILFVYLTFQLNFFKTSLKICFKKAMKNPYIVETTL